MNYTNTVKILPLILRVDLRECSRFRLRCRHGWDSTVAGMGTLAIRQDKGRRVLGTVIDMQSGSRRTALHQYKSEV